MRAAFGAFRVLYRSAGRALSATEEQIAATSRALSVADGGSVSQGLVKQLDDLVGIQNSAAESMRDLVIAAAGLIFGLGTLLGAILDVIRFCIERWAS